MALLESRPHSAQRVFYQRCLEFFTMKANILLMVLYWVFLVIFIFSAWTTWDNRISRVLLAILLAIIGLVIFGNPIAT